MLDPRDEATYLRDAQALVKIVGHKTEQLGVNFWLPPLKEAKAVFIAEEDGVIEGGLVFSPLTEMSLIGDHPSVIRTLMDEEEKIRAVLKRSDVSDMVLFLPRQLINHARKSAMQRIAERLRFRRIDDKFAAFEGEV